MHVALEIGTEKVGLVKGDAEVQGTHVTLARREFEGVGPAFAFVLGTGLDAMPLS
jgi:hypothetical protein